MPSTLEPKKPKPTLGEQILFYRTKAQKTQLELAHAIGYTGPEAGSYISRLESGAQQPRLVTVQKIAKALGVSVGKLIS